MSTSNPQLPAYLQRHVESNGPSADVASLASSTTSTPRVSLRGRMFRFVEGNEEVFKSNGPINVHVFGVEPGPGKFTKTWYEKAYSGASSDNTPPDCSSDDGVVPNPWASKKQHHECATCPKNQYGSATSRAGKPSKSCADSKRLYVSREDDIGGTIYLLQAPVSSLKSLSTYGRQLADMGVDVWMPKTKLTMADSEFPEIEFEVGGFVTEAQLEPVRLRSEKKEWAAGRLARSAPPPAAALPDHIARQMGIQQQAAAPAATPAAAPSVDMAAVQQQAPVVDGQTAQSGDAPSSNDVLSNW